MKSKKHILAIYTFLLALVFMSPQLMKPLHFAFMHHDKELHSHKNKNSVYSSHEKECVYCDFHFFHFITELNFYKALNPVCHKFSKKANRLIIIPIENTANNVLGRAPPFYY